MFFLVHLTRGQWLVFSSEGNFNNCFQVLWENKAFEGDYSCVTQWKLVGSGFFFIFFFRNYLIMNKTNERPSVCKKWKSYWHEMEWRQNITFVGGLISVVFSHWLIMTAMIESRSTCKGHVGPARISSSLWRPWHHSCFKGIQMFCPVNPTLWLRDTTDVSHCWAFHLLPWSIFLLFFLHTLLTWLSKPKIFNFFCDIESFSCTYKQKNTVSAQDSLEKEKKRQTRRGNILLSHHSQEVKIKSFSFLMWTLQKKLLNS